MLEQFVPPFQSPSKSLTAISGNASNTAGETCNKTARELVSHGEAPSIPALECQCRREAATCTGSTTCNASVRQGFMQVVTNRSSCRTNVCCLFFGCARQATFTCSVSIAHQETLISQRLILRWMSPASNAPLSTLLTMHHAQLFCVQVGSNLANLPS